MKLMTKFLLVVLTISTFAWAQANDLQSRADNLAKDGKRQEAAAAYAMLAQQAPENGYAWLSLGNAYLTLGKNDLALQAFDKSLALRYRPLLSAIGKARVYALEGQKDKMMGVLQSLVANGAGGAARAQVLSNAEFNRYSNDPQFQELLKQMQPCTSAEYRKFDFWVGDWEVQDPHGNVVGKNQVTLEQSACLIVEHWTASTGGQTGTSFNYYDVRDKKWHQLYLDNSGNAGSFPAMAGDLVDNQMVLLTDPNSTPLSRWTWYVLEPGKVRQMAESSSDNGRTWQITWDSVYVKKN